MSDDASFLKRLMETFLVEAREHLAAMSTRLLELERPAPAGEQPRIVESLFREAHSLKGAARSVNLLEVERICQSLESVMASLKRNELDMTPACFDVLHRTLDALAQGLSRVADGMAAFAFSETAARVGALDALLPADPAKSRAARVANEAQRDEPAAQATQFPQTVASGADTVRISTARLEALLLQAEDLQALKFSANHLADELGAVHGAMGECRKQWDKNARHARAMHREVGTVRINGGATASSGYNRHLLLRVLENVERDELAVKSLGDRIAQIERAAARDRRALAGMVDKLLDGMKQTLMLPFASLLELMPKLVRDLAHDSGKEIEVVMSGTEIEIDRRILESMKTPLIHLVRNAVDHGIEDPAERERKGKPRRGRISIEVASVEGSKVQLAISDDGRGVDFDTVKARALAMGLARGNSLDQLETAQVSALLFESGLSTRARPTSLSGHGLGLAIVREKVEGLGGTIAVEALPLAGVRFRIHLPATLATYRGLVVVVADSRFVLPLRNVERVGRVRRGDVKTIDGRETIEFDGQVLALARAAAVLGLAGAQPDSAHLQIAVLASAGKRAAFAVDEVVGEQDVLVKPLGPPLKRVRHVAGVTLLGAGRVVPLLNADDLLKSAARADPACELPGAAAMPVPRRRPSLLVVEDSPTSRNLLKGILESVGYEVSVAVDGVDAIARLRSGRFDLVLSDVEMPRMDGFELVSRVRADKALARLPVVLLTALESPEDQQRGADAGASAYMQKRGFDQGRLLDVIGALL